MGVYLVIFAATWLAAVFAVSGITKLLSPEATADLMVKLLPPYMRPTSSMVRVFAGCELLLAGALLVSSGWVFALAAGVALLASVAFSVIAVVALRLPEPVDCGCFGDLIESRTGRGMVVRNVVILAVAVALAGAIMGGVRFAVVPLLVAGEGNVLVAGLAAIGAITVAGLFLFASRNSGLLGRSSTEDSPSTIQYAGRLESIPSGIGTGTTLLLRAGCSGCERVIDRLETLMKAHPDADIGATIIIDSESASFAASHPLVAERAEYGFRDLRGTLGISAFPAAVFVEPDGRFLRRLGAQAVLELLPAEPDYPLGTHSPSSAAAQPSSTPATPGRATPA